MAVNGLSRLARHGGGFFLFLRGFRVGPRVFFPFCPPGVWVLFLGGRLWGGARGGGGGPAPRAGGRRAGAGAGVAGADAELGAGAAGAAAGGLAAAVSAFCGVWPLVCCASTLAISKPSDNASVPRATSTILTAKSNRATAIVAGIMRMRNMC